MGDEKKEVLIIDISDVSTSNELHTLLKKQLQLPDFYGMNWNAFWDSITGLVEMPNHLIFVGWNDVKSRIPHDIYILDKLLKDLNRKYPSWGCNVEYK
jgi:RNAse (barnase) inhibitor barstar